MIVIARGIHDLTRLRLRRFSISNSAAESDWSDLFWSPDQIASGNKKKKENHHCNHVRNIKGNSNQINFGCCTCIRKRIARRPTPPHEHQCGGRRRMSCIVLDIGLLANCYTHAKTTRSFQLCTHQRPPEHLDSSRRQRSEDN